MPTRPVDRRARKRRALAARASRSAIRTTTAATNGGKTRKSASSRPLLSAPDLSRWDRRQRATFANLRPNAPSNTVSALGGKNYYEWGETVYIVVYDLLAEPFGATGGSRYQDYTPGLTYPNPQGGVDNSVTIIVTDKTGGTQLTHTLSLSGRNNDGTGALLQYYYNGTNYTDGAPATRNGRYAARHSHL